MLHEFVPILPLYTYSTMRSLTSSIISQACSGAAEEEEKSLNTIIAKIKTVSHQKYSTKRNGVGKII